MSSPPQNSSEEFQAEVDHRFQILAEYWRDLYGGSDLFSVVHQERHNRLLNWFQDLPLPRGVRVLDLGCGAGIQAVDLALRGAVVDGVDSVEAMVTLGRERAEAYEVVDRTRFTVGDAHLLPFSNESYDLVIAMGVLPYLYDPEMSIAEIRRVLRPNGFLILSSHNTYRLSQLLDPRFSACTRSMKEVAHRLTGEKFRHTAPVRTFTLDALRRLLLRNSLSVVMWQSFGFGPFTLFGFHPISERAGVAVHRRLQAAADRGVPIIRDTGNQHLVVARKCSH